MDTHFEFELMLKKKYVEIRALRHAIWTHVASRRHFPQKVFFGADDEVMLYGTVKYVLKADAEGKEVEVPWAGRVVFDLGSGEDVKMKFYQVYLVCIPYIFDGVGMVFRANKVVCACV